MPVLTLGIQKTIGWQESPRKLTPSMMVSSLTVECLVETSIPWVLAAVIAIKNTKRLRY